MTYNKFSNLIRSLLAAMMIAFVAACSDSGDTSAPTERTGPGSSDEPIDVHAGLDEIDESGEGSWGDIVYGDDNAPIEIIEYASLTCPHCADFAAQIFPRIKEKYIDTGKVKFVYRNFIMNQYDLAASTVARCKTDDVTKKLMKVYFERQSSWLRTDDVQGALASLTRRAAGMSRVEFDRCVANQNMQKHLIKMARDGQREFNITGTPTIIVDGDKVDNYGWDNLQTVIDDAL